MDWLGLLAEQSIYPHLLATLGMLGLAGVLLWLDFDNTAHRAFALLLIFRGVVMFTSVVREFAVFFPPAHLGGIGDLESARFWGYLSPYFVIPMPFLIIWFASVYPRRRGWFGATRWGPWVLILAAAALEVIYFLDHGTYVTEQVLQRSDEAGNAWTAIAYRAEGPLSNLLGLMYLGLATLTFIFTIDYVKLPPGPRKNGVFVVLLGFLVNSTYDGVAAYTTLLADFDRYSSNQILTMSSLGLVAVVASLVWLMVHSIRETDRTVDQHIRRAFILAAIVAASAFLAVQDIAESYGVVQLVLTGFWRLWLPALVTYALVRHQLFDIDLKLKFALKQSTLAGFALVGFLIFSEVLETIITQTPALTTRIPSRLSDLTSLGVAVGLTYALNPVQRFAENFTNRAMPNTQAGEEYLTRKRLEVYRATLEGAVEDGAMTERETRLLERLREQLGLTQKQTKPILAEVLASYEGRTIGRRARGT